MTQLKKHHNTIGNLIPQMPKTNIRIYDAYKTEIRIMDYNSNEQMNELVKSLGQWAFYLGLSDKISENELILNANFIREHFGSLNIVDISEVIKLLATDPTMQNVEHYGTFSPIYISKVLHLYKAKKGKLIVETNSVIAKLKREQEQSRPTKAESVENMKFIISDAWEKVHSQKDIYTDFGDLIYNFVMKYKLVEITKELVETAKKYAKEQVVTESRQSALKRAFTDLSFEKTNKEQALRKKGREYIANEWIKSMNKEQVDKFIKQLDKT